MVGRHVLVTSGPTHEPIDPVRYLANRSSGRQGHAVAAAAAEAGARVTLVSGPVAIPDPAGVTVVRVESAREMLAAVEAALPADLAIFAAAVGDWRPAETRAGKIKKDGSTPAPLQLVENPDILATIAGRSAGRPPPRRRLCRRDRRRDRERAEEDRAEGLRLDRGQRRLGGGRGHGRHREHRPPRRPRRRQQCRDLAEARQGGGRTAAGCAVCGIARGKVRLNISGPSERIRGSA
ncbi:protein of unknown function [Methylorubrum extorquens]|uniref:DNA/pantothenate metabolism flavoprotein C-terminal domain-containing protein n=1 Tax=Methylorubrum extorquens TaxID=408 RepID=A0A2N9ALM4_METEX|nr:protein of unknown function [Methylorubrum extorquens]